MIYKFVFLCLDVNLSFNVFLYTLTNVVLIVTSRHLKFPSLLAVITRVSEITCIAFCCNLSSNLSGPRVYICVNYSLALGYICYCSIFFFSPHTSFSLAFAIVIYYFFLKRCQWSMNTAHTQFYINTRFGMSPDILVCHHVVGVEERYAPAKTETD